MYIAPENFSITNRTVAERQKFALSEMNQQFSKTLATCFHVIIFVSNNHTKPPHTYMHNAATVLPATPPAQPHTSYKPLHHIHDMHKYTRRCSATNTYSPIRLVEVDEEATRRPREWVVAKECGRDGSLTYVSNKDHLRG